jgi:hypothetical protein
MGRIEVVLLFCIVFNVNSLYAYKFVRSSTLLNRRIESSLIKVSLYKGIELPLTASKPLNSISNRYMMKSSEQDSDIFSIISNTTFSLWAGVIGIFIILFNRLSIDIEKVSDIQSRADLISLIACSALLLNVLSEQDISARDRDAVPLVGFSLKEPLLSSSNTENNNKLITWLIQSAISTTPAKSVHVIINGKVVGRGGVIGNGDNKSDTINTSNMSILNKALDNKEEVYLPDLQILPGKVEFTYLPINAQSVLVLPLSFKDNSQNAIIISTNQAKVFRLNDLARIRVLANIFTLAFRKV